MRRPELTELKEALLDASVLEEFLLDLLSQAEVLEVKPLGSPAMELTEAVEVLIDGPASGLQIDYIWEGLVFQDTLYCGRNGVQLVRCDASFK